MGKNEEYELEELKNQVALLTRYVRVLQDKVKELTDWKSSQEEPLPRRATFSDFPREMPAPRVDNPLGKSIADITRYPLAQPRNEEG